MTANTRAEALGIVHELLPGLMFDPERSTPNIMVYSSGLATVVDLGDQLKVDNGKGQIINIWIEGGPDGGTR